MRLLPLIAFLPLLAYGFDLSPSLKVRPDVSSFAYMSVDPHTGSEIISSQADIPLPPASLTKVMTAYVVAEKLRAKELDLLDEVEVSAAILATEGSKMFLQPNRLVTLDQLLFGLIVLSANDAAITIAQHIAGSEEKFVELMNYHAQSLGMHDCYFANSSGLPHPEMKCSLRSLMLLSSTLITQHPAFYRRYFATKEYSYNNISQPSSNRLLFHLPEVDGIKTGYTTESDYNLLASAVREKHRFVVGVLGAKTEELRNYDAQKLLNYSFLYYKRYVLYRAEESISRVKLWKGKQATVGIGLAEDLYLTLPYVARQGYNTELNVPAVLRAPITKGETLGEMLLIYDGKELLRRPLIALEDVEEAGFITSFVDELLIFLGR